MVDGHRFTCFVTGTRPCGGRGPLAGLELRLRQRARFEGRIRTGKGTGLRNLPLHGFAASQVWLELIALAVELTAWAQCSPCPATRPGGGNQRLCLCVFSIAGRLVKDGRRVRLRLATSWRWADLIATAITRLQMLPAPRQSTSRPNQTGSTPPPGPWNPANPTRQSGPTVEPSLKNDGRLGRVATQPTSRKIEVKDAEARRRGAAERGGIRHRCLRR